MWPRSTSKSKRAAGDAPMDVKPDWDNWGKQICDVLERCGFVWNDSQFADVRVRKLRSDRPGADIVLEEM